MTCAEPVGMHIQGFWFLSPAEALEALHEGALLVDLRSDELHEMKAFAVPQVVHLPHTHLEQHLADLPKNRLLVLADASGVYTRGAATILAAGGFTQVACLNGGMLAWDQGDLPVITDPEATLQGECACVMRSRKERP